MVIDDYTSAAGGSLKLKGVKDSKIDKKKKKKKKTQPEDNPTKGSATSDLNQDEDPTHSADSDSRRKMLGNALAEEDGENEGRPLGVGKTEAERRHEERRRKRLDERLKREGVKTHKERVEELNRYLSNLSEHHDMPRIGPG